MERNKKNQQPNEEKELVSESTEEKNPNEYRPKVSWFYKIPYWIKAIVLKYWFFGLEYYLIEVGLGYFFQDASYAYVLMLILGFCKGVFDDLFVYSILDVMEHKKGQAKPFVLIKTKKIWSLFINVIYGFVWGIATVYIGTLFDLACGVPWEFQPLAIAFIGFLLDAGVVGLKDLIVLLVNKLTHQEVKL